MFFIYTLIGTLNNPNPATFDMNVLVSGTFDVPESILGIKLTFRLRGAQLVRHRVFKCHVKI